MHIPIDIEGEGRLKDGTRKGTFSFPREYARAFFDMQERAEQTGKKIGLVLITEKAEVMPSTHIIIKNAIDQGEKMMETLREAMAAEAGAGETE